MAERWSFYIDVEGFRFFLAQDKPQAVNSLGELMCAIFRIGRLCYPTPPDRLFAHQFGDGFIVVGNQHEESLDRCAAVATAVMRHVATSGCFCRAAIAEGELADIQSCYPDEVMSCREDSHRVSLGRGLMTFTSVMGTALTRTVGLSEKGKPHSSGPLLLASAGSASRIDRSVPRQPIPRCPAVVSIDWVHMESAFLDSLQTGGCLNRPSPSELEHGLARYCDENRVRPKWKANVRDLLGVRAVSDRA
jgi:hypothetical protein